MPECFNKIGQKYLCEPDVSKEEPICQFLEYTASKGIDIHHPYLSNFDLQNHDSLIELKEELKKHIGHEGMVNFFLSYVFEYLKKNEINWDNLPAIINLRNSLMKEPEKSCLYELGEHIQLKTNDYVRVNHKECSSSYYDCNEILKAFDNGVIYKDPSYFDKAILRYSERGSWYVISRAWDRAREYLINEFSDRGAEGVDKKYFNGELKLKNTKLALSGFKILDPYLDGEKVGTFIIGNPNKGAKIRAKLDFSGNGVSIQYIEKNYKNKLQYHGTFAMEQIDDSVENKIHGMYAINGNFGLLVSDPKKLHGFVLFYPDGTVKIIDKGKVELSKITKKASDKGMILSFVSGSVYERFKFKQAIKENKITLLSAAYFNPSNESRKWSSIQGDRTVRLFFTFQNGLFGIYDTESNSTNEMLAILYRVASKFGKLEGVVRCERGKWDSAMYYTSDGNKIILGDIEEPPNNRIIFYTE